MSASHVSPLYYPLDYVFGFEMDIIVKFYTTDYQLKHHGTVDRRTDAFSPRDTVIKQIVKRLRENFVEVDGPGYSPRRREDSNDGTNAWVIDEGPYIIFLDNHGEESETGEWSFCAVKMISPVLQCGYPAYFELDRVLSTIRENFEVVITPTCGLDVHIGTNYPCGGDGGLESKGYPLQTLKNLLQLVSIFRPQLSDIHPPCRVVGEGRQFPKGFFLRNMDPLDAAAVIDSCDCIFDLFKLWEHSEHPTRRGRWVNPLCEISNLLSRAECNTPEHPTRTVLFRQHQATLDFERIHYWIELLVRMVEFSHECGPGGLPLSLLLEAGEEHITQAGSFDTIAFLTRIGARACARFYQDRLYTHESAPYIGRFGSEDLIKFFKENVGYSSSGSEVGEEVILTPPESPSTIASDYEDAASNLGDSLSVGRGSPPPPMYEPPDSSIDRRPARKGENSTMAGQGRTTSNAAGEWSYVADVLSSFGGSSDSEPRGSCRAGNFFDTRSSHDSEEHTISTGVTHPTCDLTHRKVQY